MSARTVPALIALCCLVAVPLANGCGPNTNNTPDAGDTGDAGHTSHDAGSPDCTRTGCAEGKVCNETTKLCEVDNGGKVGEACNGATEADPQGSCASGLVCSYITAGFFGLQGDAVAQAVCTKFCNDSSDCGEHGSVGNYCYELPEGYTPNGELGACAQGCSSDDACSDTTAKCLQPQAADNQVCVPGCSRNTDCTYGATCDSTLEICQFEQCTTNDQCGANRVCASLFGAKLCVDDCTQGTCPDPFVCDTTTKACKAPGGTYYQSCSQQNPCTESDATCITFAQGATAGICLQACPAPNYLCGGVPEGQDCTIQTSSGTYCLLACTAGGANPTTCPDGTTCKTVFSNSSDTYCAP